ncbi:MAG: hypothetical protein AAFW46_09395 [Pseudomonadota bacterium]
MTDLTKIDVKTAIPVGAAVLDKPRTRRPHTVKRTQADAVFMELMSDLNGFKPYHQAATVATYAIGVIAAGVLFAILTALVG